MAPAGRMRVSMRSGNARMWSAGPHFATRPVGRGVECNPPAHHSRAAVPLRAAQFSRAFFGSTGKSIVTGSGMRPFCPRWNMGARGMCRGRSASWRCAGKRRLSSGDMTSLVSRRTAASRQHDTTRTIAAVRIRTSGPCLVLEFSGDGFLYKMVRLMVGALVRCGRGQAPAGEIRRRLRCPGESAPRARLVAPAEGLFQIRVRY